MSRAVAMASAALRRLAAVSRPVIAARAIPVAPVGRPVLLFRPSPALFFPNDLSRGYARSGGASPMESDAEDWNDEVSDDGDSDYKSDDEDSGFGSASDMIDEFEEPESDSKCSRRS